MPKRTALTFSVQPVEKSGRVSGYVVAGFFNKRQLAALHSMTDRRSHKRTKKLKTDIKSIQEGMAEAMAKATN